MTKTSCTALFTAGVMALLAGSAMAEDASATKLEQPILVGDRLVFPEGAAIPRFQTPIEIEFSRNRPEAERGIIGPPRQPLRATAEYEPVAGIVMSNDGTTAWNNILYNMCTWITREGNADVYMCVDTASEQTALTTTMTNYVSPDGRTINMSRVRFHVRTTDSIWLRDYGPRFAYEGDIRIVTDHTYNYASGRPNDDNHPPGFAPIYKFPYYDNGLRHGGGNYHLDNIGRGLATRLLNTDNSGLSEPTIVSRIQQFWGVNTAMFNALPTSIDGTQHIDMWMQVTNDNTVIVGDFQNSTTGDNIVNAGATALTNAGWNVVRTPNWSLGGIHYTYTNMVMCNNIVMVPTFTNATVAPNNAASLAAIQSTLPPGKTAVGIPCEGIIAAAGAIHCIVMHMPLNKNGVNPGMILYTLNGGEVLNPNQSVEIRWASDDDTKPQALTVDIVASLDGGATWPVTIANATADDGSFFWTVPDLFSTTAKVRVIGRDAQNNTGSDDSDAVFTLNGTPPPPPCPGDTNGDRVVDSSDLSVLLSNFGQSHSGGPGFGDFNEDRTTDSADLSLFLANFGLGC